MMERVKSVPEYPVLFVLDEFPVLGYMQSIETAAGLMAGFGVKLWPIVQNIGQLKQHYTKSWETFIANSGIVTACGVSDPESLETLSNCLGRTNVTLTLDSHATRHALLQGASTVTERPQDLPLLADQELRLVFGRGTGRLLVFNAESSPAVTQRFIYFDDDLFKNKYDPDPKYERRL